MSRVTIDHRHPQRELFARWIQKEGLEPNRVQSITFNGASPRSSETATLVLLKRTRDRDENGIKGKPHPFALNDEVATYSVRHRIRRRPPKIEQP